MGLTEETITRPSFLGEQSLVPALAVDAENKVLRVGCQGYWVGSISCVFAMLTKWFSSGFWGLPSGKRPDAIAWRFSAERL
jgi:hypothetical protein